MREREVEALNDHLARLLAQGDEILREWKTYSENLRATIDRQIAGLDAELARGVEKAAKTVAPRAAAEIAREVEGLRAELHALRQRTAEIGGRRDWRRHLPWIALVVALVANGLVIANFLRPPSPVPLLIETDR